MESKNLQNIKQYIESGIFDDTFFDKDSLIILVIERLNLKLPISIIYGETYDLFGLTIDSLKYYLILEKFTKVLREIGLDVSATLLIGDTASIRNINVTDKDAVLSQIKSNLAIIEDLKKKYNFNFKITLMSSILETSVFKERFESIKYFFKENLEIQNLLQYTVLENKLKQEKETGFQYSLEEIAVISEYDIKIGPPREQHYDKASLLFTGCKPFGIYVKPTYPLGFNYDYFINHPEIEEFGLTPYKAGSNKLQRNRILLNETSRDQVKKLINSSYIPQFSDLPNPVNDLYNITLLSESVRNTLNGNLKANLQTKSEITKLFTDEFHEHLK